MHALARQLSATPDLINYKHRRGALRHWYIGPAAWQDIISQLPPTKGPFQPELSDCKRQFASEAIWAHITQGEHLLAPRIIENHLSAGDPTWHRRRDNMWHFYLATPAKPHYAALREILSAHADDLAAIIDRQPHPAALSPALLHWPDRDYSQSATPGAAIIPAHRTPSDSRLTTDRGIRSPAPQPAPDKSGKRHLSLGVTRRTHRHARNPADSSLTHAGDIGYPLPASADAPPRSATPKDSHRNGASAR